MEFDRTLPQVKTAKNNHLDGLALQAVTTIQVDHNQGWGMSLECRIDINSLQELGLVAERLDCLHLQDMGHRDDH